MSEGTEAKSPLAPQRRQRILEWVTRDGFVRVTELVERLGVSEMTVRRDINELAGHGSVERVHGGAVAASGAGSEPLFSAKVERATAQKEAIGHVAASRVRPGESLILSAGSTTLAVARAIAAMPYASTLTVLTNSLPAADVLSESVAEGHPSGGGPTVLLTGGQRTRSDALVGPLAVDAARSMRVKWAFLGAHAVDGQLGLMTPNLEEAQVNQTFVGAAGTVVAVTDHSKWGVPGLRSFCSLADLDLLVTDAETSGENAEALEQAGVIVERA